MTGRTCLYITLLGMFVTALLTLAVSGCDNAYLSSNSAAALADQAVEKHMASLIAESQKQTALLQRIAVATEKQAGIAHAEAGWSK